jgi:Zn-dependent metalloprotease
VHSNSGIANHAFYLAVVGGTNRVSGLPVTGVGIANMEQMEKVFYRGLLLPLVRRRFRPRVICTERPARSLMQ